MTNKLFVKGLSYGTDNHQLVQYFAQSGTAESTKVIIDRMTNQSKGFAFIEMSSAEEAQKAINTLNNTELDGRTITVQEAKPQEKKF